MYSTSRRLIASTARTMAASTPLPAALARSFPTSTTGPSSIFAFPGTTPETTATVRHLLEINDRGSDIWGKLRFTHNHFPHSALTRYALGASSASLENAADSDWDDLAPLDPTGRNLQGVPDTITKDNWVKHVGAKEAYSRYLPFFHNEVERLGPLEAVKTYLFSDEADAAHMIPRLFSGAFHPFIHLGFGLEFGDRIVVAEGLAATAVHQAIPVPPVLLRSEKPTSLLAIYAEFSEHPDLDPGPYDPDALINDRLKRALKHAPKIQQLVGKWSLGPVADEDWPEKVEQIAWLVTLLAGATSRPGYPTRIDFFLMHALTSSIFLPAYLTLLAPDHRSVVLETYVFNVLVTALARGRPQLYVGPVMSYTPRKGTNPWLDIVDNSLVAPDSHVPKSIRALCLWAQRYGTASTVTVPGAVVDGKEAFPGAALLDGTLFLRVAGMIMDVLGWIKEGQKEGSWDRSALGWDGAWN